MDFYLKGGGIRVRGFGLRVFVVFPELGARWHLLYKI